MNKTGEVRVVLDEAHRGPSGEATSEPTCTGEAAPRGRRPIASEGHTGSSGRGGPSFKPRGGSPFLSILENNEAPSVSVEAEPDSTRAAVLPALKVTAAATVNSACVDRSRAAPEAGDAGRTWEGQAGFSRLEHKRPERANTHQ